MRKEAEAPNGRKENTRVAQHGTRAAFMAFVIAYMAVFAFHEFKYRSQYREEKFQDDNLMYFIGLICFKIDFVEFGVF